MHLHHGAFLELEVGDLLETDRYRVFAIDNNVLAFSDVTLNAWPVIVVTHPKVSAASSGQAGFERAGGFERPRSRAVTITVCGPGLGSDS